MERCIFLHPDLGIGGAERAMVDAAMALKENGKCVQFVTCHHSASHCFPETCDGSLKVTVVGDWLPRRICGRFYALCAYIRILYAALYLVFFSSIQYDVVICDQISACIPVLRFSKANIIFYCHFPDLLLTTRDSIWKSCYRKFLDTIEEKTTGMADSVLVNSKFTGEVFKRTFSSLSHISLTVVYPIPNFKCLSSTRSTPRERPLFLSINRFERKKNLALAIKAFALCRDQYHSVGKPAPKLIMAGGYDTRVVENVQHYAELCELANSLSISMPVDLEFKRSISDEEKRGLLSEACCLLYTPEREHFGMVPVEAMYSRCPVIAVNSGGPVESIVNGETGYLLPPDEQEFSSAMLKFLTDEGLTKMMGDKAHTHVMSNFSYETYKNQLLRAVNDCCKRNSKLD